VIRQALRAGHVDELSLSIAPVILGGGKRLFDGFEKTLNLEHAGPCSSHPSPRTSPIASSADRRRSSSFRVCPEVLNHTRTCAGEQAGSCRTTGPREHCAPDPPSRPRRDRHGHAPLRKRAWKEPSEWDEHMFCTRPTTRGAASNHLCQDPPPASSGRPFLPTFPQHPAPHGIATSAKRPGGKPLRRAPAPPTPSPTVCSPFSSRTTLASRTRGAVGTPAWSRRRSRVRVPSLRSYLQAFRGPSDASDITPCGGSAA
jgi:hypothetical protein